jgi:Flp pilus assembly pilin Flp
VTPEDARRRVAIVDPDLSEVGASLVEYALLIALIALVAVGAAQVLGVNLAARFQEFAGMFG